MHRSEAARPFDWRSWLTLGWVVVFGALYARMVLRERLPGAWEAIEGMARAG
ncbi:hypothetical protein [Tautonia plasticadhaerens]|uniref:Uncharacterized protein n=1 Tax=Tautonia plasticadhaerens TaxID=2527974 RepID=A0A518H051_9BACT|nr:hypothetical protein [Tautonia plasticadhaerens]QDV34217.1 hypothetical protein ElP_21020 [Tautonia plasticadhaerens]